MSNLSGISSGNSNVVYRGRHMTGIPKSCWCGSSVNVRLSKTVNNPYRRYFRCSFASSNKLGNDDHIFKWVDDAMVNEIERMSKSIEGLEKKLMEFEVKTVEQIELKMENELEVRIKRMVEEFEWRMKKLFLFGIGLGVVITIGIVKLAE